MYKQSHKEKRAELLKVKNAKEMKNHMKEHRDKDLIEKVKLVKSEIEKSKRGLALLYEYKKPGIYFLFDDEQELLYIGSSKNLGNRIKQSIIERGATYWDFLPTHTVADALIWEQYMIFTLHPPLNYGNKEKEEPITKIDYEIPSEFPIYNLIIQ